MHFANGETMDMVGVYSRSVRLLAAVYTFATLLRHFEL